MNDDPYLLVSLGKELRYAFQSGNDRQMLHIIKDKKLGEEIALMLNGEDDRALTYAAPQIADLAVRLGYVRNQ